MALLILFCLLPYRPTVAERLAALTGPDFVDCGGYMPGEPDWEPHQRQVLDCAIKAVADKKPFQFRENQMNIEGASVWGLVGTADGRVLLYEWGSSIKQDAFITKPCPQPHLYMQGRWLRFGCTIPDE